MAPALQLSARPRPHTRAHWKAAEMKVPTLYGRDEALAQVRNELRCVLLGQGSALVVRGSAGIGKTAVLRAARSLAAESDIRVLQASGVPSETNLPFAALHQLIRPLLAAAVDGSPAAARRQTLDAAFGLDDVAPVGLFQVAL